ncbi:glycosyltransferase family 2 protein [Janibacter sp. G1551]|uniref:glycosyltransferase family 2 protein n=1 Tax=Janibacter sp. G1551 TaxID=3420440 RepID=UPI003D00A34D
MTSGGNGDMARPSLSVCIVTYERERFLRRCLDGLVPQAEELLDVVVVDASQVEARADVEAYDLPVRYVWAPELAGWMTKSRNAGLQWVRGDIVAFLDDDVVVRDGWAAALREAYVDPEVAAVCGRTVNGQPGEESYEHAVGTYREGRLTEGFASIVPEPVTIDHGIGANMSFRRAVLAELGGFRDDYPGTALREDTDMFLRVKLLGGRAIFDPHAVVDHLPAPHVVGERFDTRYKLYGRRNHLVLMARHEGIGSANVWRWVASEFRRVGEPDALLDRVKRFGVTTLGIGWGLTALPRQASWRPTDPRRTDPLAAVIRRRLAENAESA